MRKIKTTFDYFDFRTRTHYDKFEFDSKIESEDVFADMKRMFYNHDNYKWQLKPCLRLVDRFYSLTSNDFITYLDEFFIYYFNNVGKTGKTGAFSFIETLKESKKFKYCKYDFSGIHLKEETEILQFLGDLRTVHLSLKISQNNFIKFIFKNFNTGLTEKTLRRYYIDNKE